MVNSVRTAPFFKSYDHSTLNWLKDLDSDYVVFSTNQYYIIMNSTDAAKLPKTTTTGVSVKSNVTCNILENKSLGGGLKNIIHVDNVEVISGEMDNFVFNEGN